MRKLLVSSLAAVVVVFIGIALSTRNVDARAWGAANGGWHYGVGQTCRNGISFGLAFFDNRAIVVKATYGSLQITEKSLTLLAQPINLDPDLTEGYRSAEDDQFDFSGHFTVPWSSPLSPSTQVQLEF